MSILVYKLIHIVGIGMIFLSMGGMSMHAILGGERKKNEWRKPAIIGHGVGMLLILVAGFGMLARLGIHWPWANLGTAESDYLGHSRRQCRASLSKSWSESLGLVWISGCTRTRGILSNL